VLDRLAEPITVSCELSKGSPGLSSTRQRRLSTLQSMTLPHVQLSRLIT
jgi:hypothetical protein